MQGRRTAQLVLAAMLLFFLAWDLRAVLLDTRPGINFTDTTLVDLTALQQSIRQQGPGGWRLWSAKGPLGAWLGAGMQLLVGEPLLAMRLLSVVCHLLLLWLVFGLTTRLCARPSAGLLAVLLCGTFPLEFGWFRLDFHEPLVALALILFLWAAAGGAPGRRASAVRLGLALGLGLLTKLSFPLFVLLPCVWLTWTAARERMLRHLLLAGGVALLLCGWWVVSYRGLIVGNLSDSTGVGETLTNKLALLWHMPGLPLLLGCSVAGAAVAWRLRLVPPGQLGLLLLSLWGALALLVGIFDWWPRYLVPGLPPAAMLAAMGLDAAAREARRRWPGIPLKLAGAALAAALLAGYVYLNLHGVPPGWEPGPRQPPWPAGEVLQRELFLGMIAPDRRSYDGYARLAARIRRRGWRELRLPQPSPAPYPALWRLQGAGAPVVDLFAARRRVRGGGAVHLLVIHTDLDPLAQLRLRPRLGAGPEPYPVPRCPAGKARASCEQTFTWLAAQQLSVLQTIRDPDSTMYSLIQVEQQTP